MILNKCIISILRTKSYSFYYKINITFFIDSYNVYLFYSFKNKLLFDNLALFVS